MELLPYQQQVLDDLADFLARIEKNGNMRKSFQDFWQGRGVARPEPYRQFIPQVPHVCIKVPTGGGKTFIAACAMRTIFDGLTIYARNEPRAVVWLVPSNAILEQTEKNLKNPQHPYRQKVNSLFNSRVAVYTKQELLQGAGFNASTVQEQLNVFVLSYASFRTSNKEGRKAFQESDLYSFQSMVTAEDLLPDTDESALINIIRSMNPVCIVDESHNARSRLSQEMLENFNPSFILDLTATPRKSSNIISYVDAARLKAAQMVKLPVIVYNHHSGKEVISNAIQLRNRLEQLAKAEAEASGDYIRPIVLFQAEAKSGRKDKTTFTDIKKRLVRLGIAKEEIAIKTANINELKDRDLLSPDCPIRYIITINALKEGWDCPFAYILATIANRHSQVDVEQIVGRVLRQPYARRQQNSLLNNSYILASSADFIQTLDKIVAGLNQAGFSKRDMRAKEIVEEDTTEPDPVSPPRQQGLFDGDEEGDMDWPEALAETLPETGLNIQADTGKTGSPLQEILDQAKSEGEAYEEQSQQQSSENISEEVRERMNQFAMVSRFVEQATQLELPQFFLRVELSLFNEDTFLFNRKELLRGFRLSQADSRIDFSIVEGEAYRVDLEEVGDHDYKPSFWKLRDSSREQFLQYIIAMPEESRKREMAGRLVKLIGNMYPIADQEVRRYVQRILDDMSGEQIHDCLEREYSYRDKIKNKIRTLATGYAEDAFFQWLDSDKIHTLNSFRLPENIFPVETAPAIPASLYESEGQMNSLETRVINEVANLDNILFWHRIIERKGFCINGFINHYPDFLIQTRKGKTLLVETKGDDRDNSDSIRKLKLGEAWAARAGNDFRYFMVFDTNAIDGAYRIDTFLSMVSNL